MKILITGASGHVGARAADYLCKDNEVYAVVRSIPINSNKKIIYKIVDLSSEWSADILPKKIDAVIHLAQSRDYRKFPEQALAIFRVNLESTAKLLDYAMRAGAKSFILTSTGGLHSPSEFIINECSEVDPPEGPLSYYFKSKHAAEMLTIPYKYLMTISVLRPFFIYGPGQSSDKLIAQLTASIYERRSIRLNGADGIVINPIFVDDVVEILSAALNLQRSQTLMMAGPDALSIKKIAEVIGGQIGFTPIFEHVNGDQVRMVADYSKIESLLDRRLTSFSDGISKLFQ